jgi:hypothetical protein
VRNNTMGLYNKLADDIDEVDIIIAGGRFESLLEFIIGVLSSLL